MKKSPNILLTFPNTFPIEPEQLALLSLSLEIVIERASQGDFLTHWQHEMRRSSGQAQSSNTTCVKYDFSVFWDLPLVKTFHAIVLQEEKKIRKKEATQEEREKEYLIFLKGARKAFLSLYEKRRGQHQPLLKSSGSC